MMVMTALARRGTTGNRSIARRCRDGSASRRCRIRSGRARNGRRRAVRAGKRSIRRARPGHCRIPNPFSGRRRTSNRFKIESQVHYSTNRVHVARIYRLKRIQVDIGAQSRLNGLDDLLFGSILRLSNCRTVIFTAAGPQGKKHRGQRQHVSFSHNQPLLLGFFLLLTIIYQPIFMKPLLKLFFPLHFVISKTGKTCKKA